MRPQLVSHRQYRYQSKRIYDTFQVIQVNDDKQEPWGLSQATSLACER